MRVSQDVMEVLDRGSCKGAVFYLPAGQLDRKLYEAVNKALACAGGKWNRKEQGHVFDDDAEAAVEPILLTGEVTDRKKALQAFYTPPETAERVVDAAAIEDGMRVLEPSAGGGVLARFAHDQGGRITCVEMDEATADKLASEPACEDLVYGDFLSVKPSDLIGFPFDRIVMNPPFSKQADARHVLHALDFLRPGGRLVAIMAASVTFRDTDLYRQVRDHASAGGWIDELPEGAFKESGTGVRTALVVIDKPSDARQDAEAAAGMRSAA
jgi:predicted RNA methylase